MVGSAGLISPVSAVEVPAPVGGPPSCTAADGSAAVVAGGVCGPGGGCEPPQAAATDSAPITMMCLTRMEPSSSRLATSIAPPDRQVEIGEGLQDDRHGL